MERLNGFDAAAKEITLSPQLIDKLPRNVRAWSCEDVILWLEDIFKDSEFLPG